MRGLDQGGGLEEPGVRGTSGVPEAYLVGFPPQTVAWGMREEAGGKNTAGKDGQGVTLGDGGQPRAAEVTWGTVSTPSLVTGRSRM